MRLLLFVVISCVLFGSCKAQKRHYSIDSSILSEIKTNKDKEEILLPFPEHSYYIFMDYETKDSSTAKKEINDIDSSGVLMPNVCGCKLENDTIYIAGGMFYGGGAGYEIKISRNATEPVIVLASYKKFKQNQKDETSKEIYLGSEEYEIVFSKEPEFKLGKYLAGKIIMNSKKYFEKDIKGTREKRIYMKVLFECELADKFKF